MKLSLYNWTPLNAFDWCIYFTNQSSKALYYSFQFNLFPIAWLKLSFTLLFEIMSSLFLLCDTPFITNCVEFGLRCEHRLRSTESIYEESFSGEWHYRTSLRSPTSVDALLPLLLQCHLLMKKTDFSLSFQYSCTTCMTVEFVFTAELGVLTFLNATLHILTIAYDCTLSLNVVYLMVWTFFVDMCFRNTVHSLKLFSLNWRLRRSAAEPDALVGIQVTRFMLHTDDPVFYIPGRLCATQPTFIMLNAPSY